MTDNDINIFLGQKNSCICLSIDDNDCEIQSEIFVSEEMITKISMFNVPRKIFDVVREKSKILLCLKKDNIIMTIITQYVPDCSYRHVTNNAYESEITMEYVSSKLLLGYDCRKKTLVFSNFTFEITDGIELIGDYPFEHKKEETEFELQVLSKGKIKFENLSKEFSYFVAPYVEKQRNSLILSYQYKLQYHGVEEVELSGIYKKANELKTFFEVLCGEIVSINRLSLDTPGGIVEYIGVNNFIKKHLQCLNNGFDTASYLRRSVFKLSDFQWENDKVIPLFIDILNKNQLAFESYKQVLLDEDVKISTYNKFLKVMQMVEGYQRTPEEENEIKAFENQKKEIIEKLTDQADKDFIQKYANYNGQVFRKCLNEFTCKAIIIISGLSKTQVKKCSDELIGKIVNDRDVYTHASKKTKPCLSFDEISYVNSCYKTFFRIIVLHELGLKDEIIRKRLSFEREFKACYYQLFNLSVETDDYCTGEFDEIMWGYDDRK